MEQKAHETLISHIFELFDTGEEAISFLSGRGLGENRYLLRDLEALCAAIASAIGQLAPEITLENKLREVGLNAPLTLERIGALLDRGQADAAWTQYTCSFVPLFLFWRRYAEFFLLHAASHKALKDWYAQERERIRRIRKTPKREEPRECQFDLSIVVLFYGNQKMTKECLDAIEAHTKGRSYELITFDNGSDPETTAWCEGLPHVKKIYYPHNMGSSAAGNLIFTMAPHYMEGKYLLYVSNDVIVTPRYDEILWACMESDPRVAMAAPVCNSASNLQAISVPYAKNDIQGMLSFAENHNHYDPRKWMDRSRLFSILACVRPAALFQVMELGRAQFRQKHGVDAWGALGMDLCAALESFSIKGTGRVRVLALNPLFGESVLALSNRLRACGSGEVTVDALTEDGRYLEDLEGLFHRSGLLGEEAQMLEGQYDIAIVGCNLGRCADLGAVLRTAARRLKAGGMLITQHENLYSLSNLRQALQGKPPADGVFLHDPDEGLGLRVVTDGALAAELEREGMVLGKSVSLTNDSWKAAAGQLISALGIQPREAAESLLLSLGRFNVWRKTS